MKKKINPKLKFYLIKLAWLFILGSVFGYLYEGILALLSGFGWSGNDGLIYGPFSQVYGFGAVILTIFLGKIKDQKSWRIFILSAVLGGAFEFLASWAQEKMFGSVSWNYSNLFLNLDGRTTIPFMLMWGLMGLLLIKVLYPRFVELLERFPLKTIQIVTIWMVILLSVDMGVSALATWRMSQRNNGVPATQLWQKWCDWVYPNSRLKAIYPKMQEVELIDHKLVPVS